VTEIQQNRWDQLIRRVAGIVGGGSQVNDTLNELFPVIDVERVPGELLLLMGTDICVGATSRTGDAGEVPNIQLFNPVDSGKLITITQAIFSVDVETRVRLATTNIPLPTAVTTQVYRDRRHDITTRPTGSMRHESQVALVDAHFLILVLANTSFVMSDENGIVVLNPGSAFEASPTSAATTMRMTYFWRERVAQASELRALGG